MEQLIYTSVASKRVGFQTISRSPGLSNETIAELEGMFGFFGPTPTRLMDQGTLSFLDIEPCLFAFWITVLQGLDASGNRRNTWVHCIVLTESELMRMGGDPFVLADHNLIKKPFSPTTPNLDQIQPPSPVQNRFCFESLSKLPPLQLEMLLACALGRGHSYVEYGEIDYNAVRAIRYLVPSYQMATLTFYGLINGVPPKKAKLNFMKPGSGVRDMDPTACATASLDNQEYHGPDPTLYAITMSRLLSGGHISCVEDLVALAETLKCDVIEQEADALIQLSKEYKKCQESYDINRLKQLCSTMRTIADPEAIDHFVLIQLLNMAEHAIDSSVPPNVMEHILHTMIHYHKAMTPIQVESAQRIFVRVFNTMRKIHHLPPPILKALAIWFYILYDKGSYAKHITRQKWSDIYRKVDSRICQPLKIAQHWRKCLESLLTIPKAPSILCELTAAHVISAIIRSDSPEELNILWNKYSKYVVNTGSMNLIIKELLRAKQHVALVGVSERCLEYCGMKGDTKRLIKMIVWMSIDKKLLSSLSNMSIEFLRRTLNPPDIVKQIINDMSITLVQKGVILQVLQIRGDVLDRVIVMLLQKNNPQKRIMMSPNTSNTNKCMNYDDETFIKTLSESQICGLSNKSIRLLSPNASAVVRKRRASTTIVPMNSRAHDKRRRTLSKSRNIGILILIIIPIAVVGVKLIYDTVQNKNSAVMFGDSWDWKSQLPPNNTFPLSDDCETNTMIVHAAIRRDLDNVTAACNQIMEDIENNEKPKIWAQSILDILAQDNNNHSILLTSRQLKLARDKAWEVLVNNTARYEKKNTEYSKQLMLLVNRITKHHDDHGGVSGDLTETSHAWNKWWNEKILNNIQVTRTAESSRDSIHIYIGRTLQLSQRDWVILNLSNWAHIPDAQELMSDYMSNNK